MFDPARIAFLPDAQLRHAVLSLRGLLARKRRPLSEHQRGEAEAAWPILVAECQRRNIDVSWAAFRDRARQRRPGPVGLPDKRGDGSVITSAGDALRALEREIADDLRG